MVMDTGSTSYSRLLSLGDLEATLGPFDSMEPIGNRSGSGECWRVRVGTEERVVKIVVRENEPGRFAREVAALERLSSPRVMRVHDHGEITISTGKYPYFRSEFVEGGSLREHLDAGATQDDSTIRSFLVELLRGLADLAQARVVHRDLKPENIILRSGIWGEPVIIDLGLSRLVDATSLTIYPWACGTWPYMAPEQLRAERANDRSDVWAAAIIAAELASGKHPFYRGERSIPHDWRLRLEAGPLIPKSRPAALGDWIARAADCRAYRRPSARRSVEILEETW
jgi:serine/threonine protein kinase